MDLMTPDYTSPLINSQQTVSSANSHTFLFCTLEELKIQGRITRWVEEWKDEITALYDETGTLHVFSSICPHFGGEFEFDRIKSMARCKWHDWSFDLKTGKCLTFAVKTKLRHYQFKQNNGVLEIFSQ